jgi:putative chitinase
MQLSFEQLQQMLPRNQYQENWFNALSEVLPEYEINNTHRIAMFMAQCAHESGGFTVLKENLKYSWQGLRKVFPKYFPTDDIAKQYASRPDREQAIASRTYANRMGNGNEASGEGFKFRGRGLIQLTGKINYTEFAQSIGVELDEAVRYVETFEGAVQSACWFWKTRGLNALSDNSDVVTCTKRINGGTNGLAERTELFERFIGVLGYE